MNASAHLARYRTGGREFAFELFVGVVTAAVLSCGLAAGDAHGDLIDASVYRDVDGGANAADLNVPGESDTFSFGPTTEPILSGGGATQFDKSRERGNGYARATGLLQFLFSQNEVSASGRLTEFTQIRGGSETAAAQAGFDATIGLDFSADVQTDYQIVGWIQSSAALDGPEVLACQRGGVVLAGDTRATPLPAGFQSFEYSSTLFPSETLSVTCAAAASGAQGSSEVLTWRFMVRFPDSGPTCADPNGDGQTTASDALVALNAAVRLADCELAVCDVDDGGSNTASDSLAILTMAVGLPFAWDCPIAEG